MSDDLSQSLSQALAEARKPAGTFRADGIKLELRRPKWGVYVALASKLTLTAQSDRSDVENAEVAMEVVAAVLHCGKDDAGDLMLRWPDLSSACMDVLANLNPAAQSAESEALDPITP